MKIKKELKLCDACCEGHLHPTTCNKKSEYKGIQGQFVVHFSICDVCKAEIFDASNLLENKRRWVRFRKMVDHIPLGEEIANMRKQNKLSQSIASSIFGGGPVAFSKYENDDLIPDESMVNLLKLAIAYPDTVKRLATLKGVELEQANYTYEDIWTRVITLEERIKKPAYIDSTKNVQNDFVYLPRKSICLEAVKNQLPLSEMGLKRIDILSPIDSSTEFQPLEAGNIPIFVVYKVLDDDRKSSEFTSTPTFGNLKLKADSITLGNC